MISFPSVTLAPLAHTCGPLLFSSSFGATGVSGLSSSSKSPISGFAVSFSATLIGAFTLSSVPSEYFTTTGTFTVVPSSPSTGV